MTRFIRRMGIGSSIIALTTASVLAVGGVAYADTIEDTIVDVGVGVTLEAGSATGGQAAIKLLNENTRAGDTVNSCNVSSSAPLVLDITFPAGVSVSPGRISITACDTNYHLTFTAAANAVSGSADVTIVSQPNGRFVDNVNIPITITQPANTKPTVAVTGVTNDATYELGSVPAAKCSVTDKEDGNSVQDAVLSGTLTNGLGQQTATCNYTDQGGLKADTKTATYTIVAANTKPTVAVAGVENGAEYEAGAVPVAKCSISDKEDGNSVQEAVLSGTLTNGLGQQTATCDYTDKGGLKADTKTATYTIVAANTKPTVALTGVENGATYELSSVPAAKCSITDTEDGNTIAPAKLSGTLTNGLGQQTATCDYTDKGGLKAETKTATYTIIPDNTRPTVAVTGVTDGAEYKDNAVPTPGCSVTDAEDAAPTTTPDISNLPADGLGAHTVTCDYTDKGGLKAVTATATYTVIPSNTKPTVAVTGVEDGATYEIGSVPAAECAVTDTEDGSSSSNAVVSGDLSHGLGSQTATCDYTDQGGLKADTVSVSYTIADTGRPTIQGKLTPATPGGSNGWYTGGVKVEFDCDDSGSGIAKCEGDTTLGDGANQSVTGTATDWAGNTASDTVSGVNVDSGKPTIEGKLSPGAPNGANGWYTTSVGVEFTCADTGSGIDTCDPKTSTVGDGANQSITGTATDLAGNTATDTLSGINVDTLKPTIQGKLSPATPNGSNGWYTSDVKVEFSCDDAGSGVDTCLGGTTLGEGANQSVTGTATDRAGSTATDSVTGINVDKTGPTGITVSGVSDYFFGSTSGSATCTATDGLSGFDKCEVTGFGSTAAGKYTATARATDLAGNVTTKTVAYEVKPWKATGFYSPVDMGGVVNSVKGGSTVPLKFEAFGAAEFTSTSVVKSFSQKQFTCSSGAVVDEIEVVSTGKTELRYDAVAGQFIQNWQTPKAPGSCYLVTMTLQDGTALVASFKLK